MNELVAEFLGTLILILLGNGVVANLLLKDTKGNGSDVLTIYTAWGLAVFVAVLMVAPYSGAHINPAVTIGLAVAGKFAWSKVASFIAMQMLGAFTGSIIVYLFYKDHYDRTEDKEAIKATFCTAPAIRKGISNLFSETIGTFVLILAVLLIAGPSVDLVNGAEVKVGLGSLEALPVALVVFVIGMGLGGTTGYAINPARDLGPRIAYFLLPIKNKRDSDWSYSWVPVIGPILGAILAAVVYLLVMN